MYQLRLILIKRIYICKTLRGNLAPNKISQRYVVVMAAVSLFNAITDPNSKEDSKENIKEENK